MKQKGGSSIVACRLNHPDVVAVKREKKSCYNIMRSRGFACMLDGSSMPEPHENRNKAVLGKHDSDRCGKLDLCVVT